VGRVREEKRREEERRSEKRKSQKKEDVGARKGRKVARNTVFFFPMIAPKSLRICMDFYAYGSIMSYPVTRFWISTNPRFCAFVAPLPPLAWGCAACLWRSNMGTGMDRQPFTMLKTLYSTYPTMSPIHVEWCWNLLWSEKHIKIVFSMATVDAQRLWTIIGVWLNVDSPKWPLKWWKWLVNEVWGWMCVFFGHTHTIILVGCRERRYWLAKKVLSSTDGPTVEELEYQHIWTKKHGILTCNMVFDRWILEIGFDGYIFS
jgi:hypothetical protein